MIFIRRVFMNIKNSLENILSEILRWSAQLNIEQLKRKRNDCNDKAVCQTLRYWKRCYINALQYLIHTS
jgi:hypothetical protein